MARTAVLAVLAAVAAFAYTVQPNGDNQNAHYALTRALADGRATIDEIRGSGPERLQTNDVVPFRGHLYAAKAPGLGLAALPAYLVARGLGMRTTGEPRWIEWVLHLWVSVVPAAVLLLLVLRLGDRVAPGYGVVAAAALGIATLALPFAQLLFAHVLAAAFGFAAFALLWRRAGPARAALAGVLAGLAVTVDYPLGLVALALAAYTLVPRDVRWTRAAAYAAGLAAGIAPAFAYNWWAFGSPTHFPYEGWHAPSGEPYPGVFGINTPSLSVALQLLLIPGGIAPILAPALVGLVLMARRGFRAEAFLVGGLAAAYVLYNASSVDPFGGASPGPRYLVPLLPFLAVPLAAALARLPGPVLGLAAAAATTFALYSVTAPLAAWDGQAFERLRAGSIVPTVLDPLGITGRPAIVPFGLLLAAAALLALAAAGLLRLPARELASGVAAAAGWILVTWQTPRLADAGLVPELALIGLVALGAAAVAAVHLGVPLRRAPAPANPPPLRR